MKQLSFIVKHYNNLTPTKVEATNYCIRCQREFTPDNPICCDDGCSEDGFWHVQGNCKNCCIHGSRLRTFQPRRSDIRRSIDGWLRDENVTV